MQQSKSFGHDFGGEEIDARRIAARPGEAGDETSLTGSSAAPKAIGIVVVAAFAAWAPRLKPGVAITATRRRTRSAMTAESRWYWPSIQWYSIVTFWPST